jgi:hypothetical protein
MNLAGQTSLVTREVRLKEELSASLEFNKYLNKLFHLGVNYGSSFKVIAIYLCVSR